MAVTGTLPMERTMTSTERSTDSAGAATRTGTAGDATSTAGGATSTDANTASNPDSVRRPLRMTRQRRQVLDFLSDEPGFRSAQEVHTGLRSAEHRIGLATVYRTLQALADSGELDTLRRPDGEQGYRRCLTTRHHHHLVCRSCGTVIEVEDEPVRAWLRELCQQTGFSAEGHVVEVTGRCADCVSAASS